VGTPGVDGRGYWVMRTSPAERPYIWAEAQRGRLRQGWGWNAEMHLVTIAEVVRRGGQLSDEQHVSWRSRGMLTTEPDGMRVGDLIVTPNIPDWGVLSAFRLVGSYEFSLDAPRRWDERFGHILPVELLAAAIDRRSPRVAEPASRRAGRERRSVVGHREDRDPTICRNPPQLHGPNALWTRKIDQRTVTRRLSAAQLAEVGPLFENAKRLRALVAELKALTFAMVDADAPPAALPRARTNRRSLSRGGGPAPADAPIRAASRPLPSRCRILP